MKRSGVALFLIFAGLLLTREHARGDNAEEIRARLQWWETHHPEYVPSTDQGPAYPAESSTTEYAIDRTGASADPLATAFLARGYFLREALRTKRDMDPLSPAEISAFVRALRLTRIEFVDEEQFDNSGKRVVAVVIPNPADTRYKLIRVYRKDWTESQRLGVDLVRLVFHEYLRVIGKGDDNYVVSIHLTVTERDFQRQPPVNPACVAGREGPISVQFNVSLSFPGVRGPAYVNGADFAPGDTTSYRIFRSQALCASRAYRFDLAMYGFHRTVYLFGGEGVTVFVPSGREMFDP